jgi:hypothetical protein
LPLGDVIGLFKKIKNTCVIVNHAGCVLFHGPLVCCDLTEVKLDYAVIFSPT